MTPDIGTIGVWAAPGWSWAGLDSAAVVAELEQLGYGALWVGGSPSGDLAEIEALLAAGGRLPVATGVVNIGQTDPEELAGSFHRLEQTHPGRFVLGIGVGHSDPATRPYQRIVTFLDGLAAAGVPAGRLVLAALGPRLLTVSGARSAGAHPYLVTPEHTRQARELLASGPLLAPEQKVLLETDPDTARAQARQVIGRYLSLYGYVSNLRRLGYTEADLAGPGSDRLVDDLVIWGDEEAIRAGVAAHLRAGADHVSIQVLNRGAQTLPAYRALAPALLDLRR